MNAVLAEIIRQASLLRTDPILLEFAKKSEPSLGGKSGYAPQRPLEALGEKKLLALGVLTDRFRVRSKNGNSEPLDPERKLSVAAGILGAETVFVESSVIDLLKEMSIKVQESYSQAENKPAPKCLPFREVWISAPQLFSHDQKAVMDGMLLIEDSTAPNGRWSIQLFGEFITYGAPDQNFTDSLCIFLEEKVASVEKVQPSRQMRKVSESLGLKVVNTVSVIKLRAIEYKKGKSSESEDRKYHKQWFVRGHIRNQWMPSQQRHELKWIDPYVKGPEGAPFKERVVALVR